MIDFPVSAIVPVLLGLLLWYLVGSRPSPVRPRYVYRYQELEKAQRGARKAHEAVESLRREDPRLKSHADSPGRLEFRFVTAKSDEDRERNREVLERWQARLAAAERYHLIKLKELAEEEARFRSKSPQSIKDARDA